MLNKTPTMNSREKQLLDDFARQLDIVESQIPMLNSYERVTPYLRECTQAGITFKQIIYHLESKAWFDQDYIDLGLADAAEHKLVNSGDTVFDLGCNSGLLTSWFALRVGPTGRVLAFDPFPWNTLATHYTALINGCENVQCHTVGIAAKYGRVRIPYVDAKIYENANVADSYCFDAKLVPLDEYASFRPDFIKVDIEGAERELLLGCSKILAQDPKPQWMVEIHHEFIRAVGSDPNQIAREFLRAGYTCPIGSASSASRFDETGDIPMHAAIYALNSVKSKCA